LLGVNSAQMLQLDSSAILSRYAKEIFGVDSAAEADQCHMRAEFTGQNLYFDLTNARINKISPMITLSLL